jgi:hypothetical protein
MSKTSSDPAKYYRTGIAISLEKKAVMDERLAALGMRTIGDLTTLFVTADGIVEALLPIAQNAGMNKSVQKSAILAKMKAMSPAELLRIMRLAEAAEKEKAAE